MLNARLLHLLLIGLSIGACGLLPRWMQLADASDLDSLVVETETFRHRVLANRHAGDHLRIYVEGDGEPWIRGQRVAVDPTPAVPLLLELMHDVEHPAVYLGRPCYFGFATSRRCDSRYWTVDRYGDDVVNSMCSAANQLSARYNAKTVELVGYSGGGAIVVGMIDCTDKLTAVKTIAGNLDPERWTEHHGYLPVRYSTKRATVVAETHWQCGNDTNVPPAVTAAYFIKRPDATRIVVDDCTHATGWSPIFSDIVGE
ncbi:MAG: hypothetical protein AAFM91_13940 [Pseudomonadota bacterium]